MSSKKAEEKPQPRALFDHCLCEECVAEGAQPAHALVDLEDASTGELVRVRVPHEHRHTWAAWGSRDRCRWKGDDGVERRGLELTRGAAGITAVDGDGVVHRLKHGTFTVWGVDGKERPSGLVVPRFPVALRKAEAAGDRWITVHPNGDDEKGVPVLVRANPDGTHRIIGGAGGKLNHLRLTRVKSKEEYAKDAADKKEARASAEKERRAGLSKEQKAAEKVAKEQIKAAKTQTEKAYINSVREKMGGVSDDLDTAKLEQQGLSKRAIDTIVRTHHRKQLREANEQARKALEDVADAASGDTVAAGMLAESVRNDPVAQAEGRQLAEEEFTLREQEDEARRAARTLKGGKPPGGRVNVSEQAAETMEEAVDAAPDVTEQLQALGGRQDDERIAVVASTASKEVTRRSLQAMDDAKRLLAAAREPDAEQDEVTKKVVAKALEDAGLPENTPPDEAAEALRRAAAERAARSEVLHIRAQKLAKIEVEKSPEKALNALAYSDTLTNVASSVAMAKKLGLLDAEQAPVTAADLAAMREVLASKNAMRQAKKEFEAITKSVEAGDYDRSRRAFDVKVEPAPENVQADVEDAMRTDLAKRLLGVADPRRPAHAQAVANGHWNRLADVGLSIGGQRYLDRAGLDALGLKNASIVMRHALEADGHDPTKMLAALEKYHVESQVEQTNTALARVAKLAPTLSATVENVGDIERAMMQLDMADDDANEVQRVVGAALGSMEASATMGQVLRDKMPDELVVGGGGVDAQQTLAWLHAAGLKPGQYTVEEKGGRVRIPRESWSALLSRLPEHDVEWRKASLGIKKGEADENGWLPAGIVSRAATTFNSHVPNAPRYFAPFDASSGDYKGAIESHVGSRIAEGESPTTILPDLLSPKVVDSVKDREGYLAALKEAFPMHDVDGKPIDYNAHRDRFEALADKFMASRYGDAEKPLHAQSIDLDHPGTREAVFRMLADDPTAVAAFKPAGVLTHEEQRALRERHAKLLTKTGTLDKYADDALEKIRKLGSEPDKTPREIGMFGGMFGAPAAGTPSDGVSQEWKQWDADRQVIGQSFNREMLLRAREKLASAPEPTNERMKAERERMLHQLSTIALTAPTQWSEYVRTHGSQLAAVQAMQDEVKSAAVQKFREHYGKITGKALLTGTMPVTNKDRHIAAMDPAAGDAMRKEMRELMGKLQDREGSGRYAEMLSGELVQRLARTAEADRLAEQQQGGLFGMAMAPRPEGPKAVKAALGERYTLGQRAENQIASLVGTVGGQFNARDGALGLFPGLNMDGPRAPQQRAIKMLDTNGGRLGGWLGTGSGKSLISIGAFAHLHSKGKASHALFIAPTAVQQQFGGEMLRYTEPGKFKWATGDGMSHDERVELLKDQGTHMRVLTHQSFRDTALKLMADHRGVSTEQMRSDLLNSTARERAGWWKAVREKHGIPAFYVYNDEAQSTTEREGSDPSLLNRIMSAVTHPMNASAYLAGSGTPHKNDASEVWSQAAMLDPDRYADRAEFMQQFGSDIDLNPDAIRRELAHMTYSAKIEPPVTRTDTDNPTIGADGRLLSGGPIPLEGKYAEHVAKVDEAYKAARAARKRNTVNVDAVKVLAPHVFEGVPEAEHEAAARKWQTANPTLNRDVAIRKALNLAPAEFNPKLQKTTELIKHQLGKTWTDSKGKTRKGRASIVFADWSQEVDHIAEHLRKQGLRVATYTGDLDTKAREKVRRGFQPETKKEEDAQYDVIVGNASMEAGVNLQRAGMIVHYDVPLTAKAHQQRSGRAYRQGQEGDVDIVNLHTAHDYEQRALRRLSHKRDLAEVFESPIQNLDGSGIAGAYHAEQALRHHDADPDIRLAAK